MNSSLSALKEQEAARLWQRYDEMEARLTAPLSARMVELAKLRPGMSVLDLATGRGEPAIAAARRVGPSGRVVGVDPSATMLAMCAARAAAVGVSIDLRVGSAAELASDGEFDVALCRWGFPYMDDPVAALRATQRALRPGGVLVAALWADPEQAPYFSLPRAALARYRPVPPIDLGEPGTFYYADAARWQRDLEACGFILHSSEEVAVEVMEAPSRDELLAWCRAFRLGRLVDELPPEQQAGWAAALAESAAPFFRDGLYRLGGVTRLVVASR